MKGLFILLVLVILVPLLPVKAASGMGIITLPRTRMFLGVYDPGNIFDKKKMDVEEEFVPWDKSPLPFLAQARKEGRFPLLTVEAKVSADGVQSVLTDTIKGKNDLLIKKLALEIKSQAPQQIMVRFFHEMDLSVYPWGDQNPKIFIAAWRHVVNVFKALGVDNIWWVWSPAGNPNAPEYYPGKSYVSFVGLTILDSAVWDILYGNSKPLTFKQIFNQRYQLVKRFDKPIIIAEFGVAPPKGLTPRQGYQYQVNWMWKARADFTEFPLLAGVVYFNAINAPYPGDKKFGRPDWRIFPDMIWDPGMMPVLKVKLPD